MKPIRIKKERAWMSFYATDPEYGLVAASVLSTAQEIGLRVAAQLVAGIPVEIPGAVLKRQKDVAISLPERPENDGAIANEVEYSAAYTRTPPYRLETGVGYETCVLHRDATTQPALHHWGYLLRFPEETEATFQERFFHVWGRVTGLPARPQWTESLWRAGKRMELIMPLDAFGCKGWRVDPRAARPDSAGWEDILEVIVLTKEGTCQ